MNASLRGLVVFASIVAAARGLAQCPLDPSTTEVDDRTCYVSTTDGNDQNSGTSGSPLKTIQAAVNVVAASAGVQTIRVLPGTYEECLRLPPIAGDPPIPIYVLDAKIVADDFLTRGSNSTTILDGSNVCLKAGLSVIELGDNSSLRGFTVKGGGFSGIAAFGHVTISNNVIIDNHSLSDGGGVFLHTGAFVSEFAEAAQIENNSIRDNTAVRNGGGIFVLAEGDGLPSNVVITANTVSGNIAGDGVSARRIFGGGITVFTDSFSETDRSTVAITNNIVEENEAKGLDSFPSYGGGIYAGTYGAATETIEIKSTNAVRNNKATHGYAGGIAAWARLGLDRPAGSVAHHVLVESNAVSGNTAELGGGGVYALAQPRLLGAADEMEIQVLSNEIAGNTATGNAEPNVSGGGGILAEIVNTQTNSTNPVVLVARNSLRNNTSDSFGGGAALWVTTVGEPLPTGGPQPAASRMRFVNNLLTDNHAEDTETGDSLGEGGGAFLQSFAQGGGTSAIDFKFNTVAGNTADTGRAGGVAALATNIEGPSETMGTSTIDVSNSIIISNSGFAVGGSASPGVENTTVRIAYNDTFDNGAGPFAPQYSTAGPGNLTVDPELDAFFVPVLCSPTVDAGDPCEGKTNCLGVFSGERQPSGGVANLGHTGLTLNATVTLPDATGDDLVDGADILRLATSFASQSSQVGRYNANADVDIDGDIDGHDLSFMSAWFGKTCP